MAKPKQPITSSRLALRFQSASLVIAPDERYLVFPAIAFAKKDKALKKNLNTDKKGPRVLRVDVHELSADEARRGYYGHSGVERLSLHLTTEAFDNWVKQLEGISRKPIDLGAEIDENGNCFRLSVNGDPVAISIESTTRELGDRPPSRTGSD
jgi:hypothetical protein